MIVTADINADTARANLFEPIIIAEDDENSHILRANLLVGGEKLYMMTVPEAYGHKVGLDYIRADGQVGFASGSFDNEGRISVPLPNEMFELDDVVRCELIYVYEKPLTTHTLTVVDGEIVATPTQTTTQYPLRSGTFIIDSQLRVITETQGGEI